MKNNENGFIANNFKNLSKTNNAEFKRRSANGGVKSGESRRKKKAIREIAENTIQAQFLLDGYLEQEWECYKAFKRHYKKDHKK